ncbi:hypothetical protein JYU34_013982 [Plutella xylostella]|uniref:Uncharacterized protein n=1 Tax=Plutella xylostella TaxID=51655 RepID=A0ABQ7Q7C7_PLUXY|nr:hypothetical protein JYU34_013982 [Plutella xylostella]
MKRSKSYTWLSGLLGMRGGGGGEEAPAQPAGDEWGVVTWARAEVSTLDRSVQDILCMAEERWRMIDDDLRYSIPSTSVLKIDVIIISKLMLTSF